MYFYIHRTVKTFTELQVTNMKLFEEKTFLYTVFSYLGFLSLILLMHTKLQVTNMKLFEEKTFLYTVFSYLGFLSLILRMHREAGEGIGTSLPLSLLQITI